MPRNHHHHHHACMPPRAQTAFVVLLLGLLIRCLVSFVTKTITPATASSSSSSRLLCSFDDILPALQASAAHVARRERPLHNNSNNKDDNSSDNNDDLQVLDWRLEKHRQHALGMVNSMVPFVIRHHPGASAARRLWTQEYIERVYANRSVLSRLFRNNSNNNTNHTGELLFDNHDRIKRTLRETRHNTSRHNTYVSALIHLEHEYRAGAAVFGDPLLRPSGFDYTEQRTNKTGDSKCRMHLRFGYGQLRVLLHYDFQPALFVQLEGDKRFTLLHPLQTERLPWERDRNSSHYGSVSSSFSSLSSLADNKTRALRHTVRAGEVLYIPPIWWHAVEIAKAPPSRFWASVSQPYCGRPPALAVADRYHTDFHMLFNRKGIAYPCGGGGGGGGGARVT